jgi:hypothetical protein
LDEGDENFTHQTTKARIDWRKHWWRHKMAYVITRFVAKQQVSKLTVSWCVFNTYDIFRDCSINVFICSVI